ncbi:MAG: hypothetical protein ACLUSP_08365 [Christensenellales bacterium]
MFEAAGESVPVSGITLRALIRHPFVTPTLSTRSSISSARSTRLRFPR